MSGRLNGKVCIVTGASSGIGKGIAQLFGREGGKVVVAARRQDKGEAVAQSIRDEGGEATFIKTDMTDEQSIRDMVAKTAEIYGTVDVLIANAGSSQEPFKFEDMDVAKHFTPLNDLIFKGNWIATSAVLPYMIEKKNGSVVYTLSYASDHSSSDCPAYAANKAALESTARSLAIQYGDRNIRFNSVLPGIITSELSYEGSPLVDMLVKNIPMRRPGTPEEIAHVFLLLATDECPFLTGAKIPVNGAMVNGEPPLGMGANLDYTGDAVK